MNAEELNEQINYISGHMSSPALFEQLAEECVELAKVSLKIARVLRNENPTPASIVNICGDFVEELTDVNLVCDTLHVFPNIDIYKKKTNRWYKRLHRESSNE